MRKLELPDNCRSIYVCGCNNGNVTERFCLIVTVVSNVEIAVYSKREAQNEEVEKLWMGESEL